MSILPDIRVPSHEIWVTLVLFFCLLLFVWVRVTNPQKITSLVSGFIKGGSTEEKTIAPDSIALFFIFICTSALLLLRILQFHGIKTRFNSGEEFLILGLLLFSYYLLKTVVLFFCGSIFQVQSDARDYTNEIYSSAHLAAVGLLVAVIILTYVRGINENLAEKFIITLLGLSLIYRTIKMFIIMMNRGLHVIYLFLYLCTLEIIPLVLLYECRNGISF